VTDDVITVTLICGITFKQDVNKLLSIENFSGAKHAGKVLVIIIILFLIITSSSGSCSSSPNTGLYLAACFV